jgi:hypothetical protein
MFSSQIIKYKLHWHYGLRISEETIIVYLENYIHEARKYTMMESAEFSLLRNWPLSVMYLKVSTASTLLSRWLPP